MAGRLSEGDLREFDRAVLVSRQYAERRGERMTVFGGVDLPHPLDKSSFFNFDIVCADNTVV